MKYRQFGKLDYQVSALGFGAMRLPVIDQDQSKIDESEAIRMMRYAFDHGVNYVDTAYPYHAGTSEGVVGRALKDGYREKVKLATKMPSWLIEKIGDCDRYLNEQFERLQTDYIDFYLLHALSKVRWPQLRDMGVLTWAEDAISDGRIKYLGFSFHDDYEVFKGIVDDYDGWTLCQIQYNFMDTEYQAGKKGLQYAAEKGLAVVVMEPIKGGQLSKQPPDNVANLYKSAEIQRSPAEWALQWIWDQPEVSTVLSGMSAMDHVVENVEAADRSGSNSLTEDERDLIKQVEEGYKGRSPIPCTACNYCLPCPNGVKIPGVFGLYNEAFMYEDQQRAKNLYAIRIQEDERAEHCEECNECEEKCPQEIPVAEWMKKAQELLE